MFAQMNQMSGRESDAFDMVPAMEGPARWFSQKGRRGRRSLSSSGSNQAREGRLVDALAVRGDEGRDTLR